MDSVARHAREILAIRDSFEQKFSDGKIKQLRKQQATAEAVREAAPNYRYLHFATHGFFADPKIRSALAPSDKPESSIDRGAMLQRATGEHPGLLSGIVLTGANQPPVEGKGDGILTALEVGELDLSGVDLATLSACESGLGKTAGGEGVLGLQRAFQTAGAQTVRRCGKFPIRATHTIIDASRFYSNLWNTERKMTKLDALLEAQRWMLTDGYQILSKADDTQPNKLASDRGLGEAMKLPSGAGWSTAPATAVLGRVHSVRRLAVRAGSLTLVCEADGAGFLTEKYFPNRC